MKVLKLTKKGFDELIPSNNKPLHDIYKKETIITLEDRKIFSELDSFLIGYNDFQKKAIISDKEKILCLAGAGSGKTLVLTKKIEFLVKYKGIDPNQILAITFTRKARQEMQDRLFKRGISTNIETFNSFSEKILQKFQYRIYNREVKVMNYGNKVMAILSGLEKNKIKLSDAIDKYFSENQKRNKTTEQLSNIFMNDCFYILDYFKSKNQELYDFSTEVDAKDAITAKLVYNICKYLQEYMIIHGLRDYSDQIIDTVNFFKKNKEFIPDFTYVLVDEYQDINSMQIELIDLLSKKNLFCVGDPRQSIFGWRGSNINLIYDFPVKYPDSEVITLDKNYRSSKHIVDFMNLSIKHMGLPNLESNYYKEKDIKLYSFASESEEFNFVLDLILKTDLVHEEIFILARTNRQLLELSKLLKQKNIDHILRTEDINNNKYAKKGEITLATVHSIKGLEAKMVILIGVNEQNFPCKATDHPIIEMIKVEDYDKEDEEKRLFYVAISRAKHKLYLTYSGKRPTYFINDEMMNLIKNE